MEVPSISYDDNDFQDPIAFDSTKHHRSTRSHFVELATKCSLCSTSWTNNGSHRIISLKCGHVFGEKCILDLIKLNSSNGKTVSCPQCSALLRKKDIRPIWPNKVFQDNDSVLNDLKQQLEVIQTALKEKTRQLDDINQQYQQCRQTIHELTQRSEYHETTTYSNQSYSLPSTIDSIDAPFQLVDTKLLSLERNVTRVMTLVPDQEMVVSTLKQGATDHGLYKMSLRDLHSCEYIGNHTGLVRDIKHSMKLVDNGNVTLLSTGLDKTLQLTSASNNCILLSHTLPMAGWSCEFDIKNSNQFYCGLANNTVLVFDIRNTKGCLMQLNDDNTNNTPLHTMISCQLEGDHQTSSFPSLVCSNLTQTYQWQWQDNLQEPICNLFQAQEKGYQPYALAVDQQEMTVMVSSRSLGSSTKHTVIQQSSNEWNVIWEYTSSQYQKAMARTDLYEGLACFSEDDGTINIRNKDDAKQTIEGNQDQLMMDIKLERIQHRHYLIALTDNMLKIYNKYA
ncbi:uncharacterized protein BX664DRAFT_318422 [Halteromyces radiatus]|uniref:uncharacterized protein n=1 Tax=Halteromyces radiatus TaxID=101107 RepID=UPI00221F8994|nr:uncharacterized protein BX664DRAFT_318422 [Halteromyces radiatus]KAI8077845.1 hypothetical protein BX664DRAFT_318422 [Halteromyces radiatus]